MLHFLFFDSFVCGADDTKVILNRSMILFKSVTIAINMQICPILSKHPPGYKLLNLQCFKKGNLNFIMQITAYKRGNCRKLKMNDYDEVMDFEVANDEAIRGFDSTHSNKKE